MKSMVRFAKRVMDCALTHTQESRIIGNCKAGDIVQLCADCIELHAVREALDRSPFDISPCRICGQPVVCLPDGLGGMCEGCDYWERRKVRNIRFNTSGEPGIRAMTTNAHGVFFGSIGAMPWSYDWSKETGLSNVSVSTSDLTE